MHKALHCTCSLKSPPSLFQPSLSVLQYKLTTVAIFLILSLIVDCSNIFILLCLQSAAYHVSSFSLLLSIFFLFISCLWRPPVCALLLPQKICLLDQLLPNPPTSFISSHAFGWLLYKGFSIFVASFLPLGLLACSLFSAAQDQFTSSSIHSNIIEKHGICSLVVWTGRWVSCPVFSNSMQFFSSPRGSIENWMPI